MIRDASAGELIQLLDQLDESVDIEAKEISEDSLGRSVWETVCAFSNEPGLDGGTLLLGVRKVEELFTFYEASGVGDLDKLINDLASGAASVFNVPVRLNIVAEKVGDANVIRVDVPEAHVSQKPVYLKNLNLPRGAMRRIGSSDQHCTQDDLIAFFHSKANEPHDTHVVSDVTFSDIDLDALAVDILRLQQVYLFSRADTIYGGTNEIQLNLIAERGLGMPREARG